jgi:phage shock protein A
LSSLERIKAKQQEHAAELEAADELAADETGSDLDAKLKSAGIVPSGSVNAKDKLAQILAAKK